MRHYIYILSVILTWPSFAHRNCNGFLEELMYARLFEVSDRMEVLSPDRVRALLEHPEHQAATVSLLRAYHKIEKLPDEFIQATYQEGSKAIDRALYDQIDADEHAKSILVRLKERFPHVRLMPLVESGIHSYLRYLRSTETTQEESSIHYSRRVSTFKPKLTDKDYALIHEVFRDYSEKTISSQFLHRHSKGHLTRLPGSVLNQSRAQFLLLLKRDGRSVSSIVRYVDGLYQFLCSQMVRVLVQEGIDQFNQLITTRALTRATVESTAVKLIADDPVVSQMPELALKFAHHFFETATSAVDGPEELKGKLKSSLCVALAGLDQELRNEERRLRDERAASSLSDSFRGPVASLAQKGPAAVRPVISRTRAKSQQFQEGDGKEASDADAQPRYPTPGEIAELSPTDLEMALERYVGNEFYLKKLRGSMDDLSTEVTADDFRLLQEKTLHALNELAQGKRSQTIPQMVHLRNAEKLAEFRPLGKTVSIRVFIGLDGPKDPATGRAHPVILRIVSNIKSSNEQQHRVILDLDREWHSYRAAR